jgi:hypothetical protein
LSKCHFPLKYPIRKETKLYYLKCHIDKLTLLNRRKGERERERERERMINTNVLNTFK